MAVNQLKCWITNNRPKFVIILFILVVVVTYASTRTPTGIYVAAMQQVEPTDVPEFIFKDETQQDRYLSDYKGKIVLLHFWATWCGPCVAELPLISRLVEDYQGKDLAVLTLSTDRNIKNSDIAFFMKRLGIRNLPAHTDAYRGAYEMTGSRGVPSTIILDRDGKLVGNIRGMFDWGKPSIHRLLEYHLNNRSDGELKLN